MAQSKRNKQRSIGGVIGILIFYMTLTINVNAQLPQKGEASFGPVRILPADTAITKTRTVNIKGKAVPYEVTVGTLPVYGNNGKTIASLLYTYYRRTDIKEVDNRPLLISFNGGPGAASLWMHLGFTSPKRLKISEEGYPVQPYGVEDNNYSVIDATDIVYVNPVNTGFSRMLNEGKPEQFFGLYEDLNYLSDWISTFVSRYNRWKSPKYLIGESYGTTRVAGLAGMLQGSHNLYINGVVLHSQCGLGQSRSQNESNILKLPFYTATAWYFKQLPADLQSKRLEDILPEVEEFTTQQYMPAVALGGSISSAGRQQIARQIARYSGVSETFVLNNNLVIPASSFWKELLRDQGFTTGRLDSRYTGIDSKDAGIGPEYSPEYDSWAHSFTGAINTYLREDLGFKTDLEYYVGGHASPWNRSATSTGFGPPRTVSDMLRQAMQQNPALQVLNQGGYYDGACDYFGAKYTLWQMDASGKLQDRIKNIDYQSGHMIYIRHDMLIKANDDLRNFIINSVPKQGEPIKYNVDTVDLRGYNE